jgi:hypothetical protein
VSTQVEFRVSFDFANRLYAGLMGSLLEAATGQMVAAFVARCNETATTADFAVRATAVAKPGRDAVRARSPPALPAVSPVHRRPNAVQLLVDEERRRLAAA